MGPHLCLGVTVASSDSPHRGPPVTSVTLFGTQRQKTNQRTISNDEELAKYEENGA